MYDKREYISGMHSLLRRAHIDLLRPEPGPVLELTRREDSKSYSLVRAICALAAQEIKGEGPPSELRGFEWEVSEEISKKIGRATQGIFVPDTLGIDMGANIFASRAALGFQTGGSGGYTVQTTLMPLVDALRAKMLLQKMGAQVFTGLQGPIAFPKLSTDPVLYWPGENPNAEVPESEAAFGQTLLSPHTAMATTAYTWKLLVQESSQVEALVRSNLTKVAAWGLDKAGLAGSGNGDPTGLINNPGIDIVSLGPNGAKPAWPNILTLEGNVAAANADIGSLGYITTPAVRKLLKQTPKNTQNVLQGFVWESDRIGDMMHGYAAGATNQLPSNLSKGTSNGVLSPILFGDWSSVYLAQFGVIEILVDPFSLKKQGTVEVTLMMLADAAHQHEESFSMILDAQVT